MDGTLQYTFRIMGMFLVCMLLSLFTSVFQYATQYAGSLLAPPVIIAANTDIGVWVNATEATCPGSPGQRCKVVIPAGEYTYTTGIVVNPLVSLECAVGPQGTLLHYNGTGTAVLVSGAGSEVRNCFFHIQNTSVVYGINLTGGSTIVDSVSFYGGGRGTTLLGIHSPNNDISKVNVWGTPGTMVECDNSINTNFSDLNMDGNANNTTSRGFVIDSGCDGIQISNWQIGYAGLHGLVVQDTVNPGHPPHWLFAHAFITDMSTGGDEWLFDSSLGATFIGFSFTNSWAAAAGQTDARNGTGNNKSVITSGSANIHISGGQGISINGGSKIRSAACDGILIDGANVKSVHIQDSFIGINNQQNSSGSCHGIEVTAAIDGLVITGNTVGNWLGETSGNQQYGIKINSAGATNIVVANNNLTNNVVAPLSNASKGVFVLSGNIP